MEIRKTYRIQINILFIFLFFFGPIVAYANEAVVPFSVKAILPENQVNRNVSYFDLSMTPGQKQGLKVQVYNSSSGPIVVSVDTHFAATNGNGIITYDGTIKHYDETMQYPFNKISEVTSGLLSIEPKSQKTVTIQVNAPEESFNGQILGGIHFKLHSNKESETNETVGFLNEYAYVIGVNIVEEGNSTQLEPQLILNDVEPGLINFQTGLQTSFSNKTPLLIDDLTFTGEVYKREKKEPLFRRVVNDFSVAPNSLFNFPIYFNNQPLEAGDYLFKATAKNDEHEWTFSEKFTISEPKADKTNDQAIDLQPSFQWIKNIFRMFIAVILVLIVIIIFLIIKQKNKS